MYKKGKVHPSPPSVPDNLSFLPSTILALASVLSADDKQTLAYLLSCCRNTIAFSVHQKSASRAEHDTKFECDCFNCYMSYWARWDNSPDRQVIHEIIEAYEECLLLKKNKKKNKSCKKKKEKEKNPVMKKDDFEIGEFELVDKNSIYVVQEDVEVGLEKSLVRKICSFVWGFWRV